MVWFGTRRHLLCRRRPFQQRLPRWLPLNNLCSDGAIFAPPEAFPRSRVMAAFGAHLSWAGRPMMGRIAVTRRRAA